MIVKISKALIIPFIAMYTSDFLHAHRNPPDGAVLGGVIPTKKVIPISGKQPAFADFFAKEIGITFQNRDPLKTILRSLSV